ncbi:MAG: VWA domain-containing protein [Planctomycetota bacterium]|nr:MAG: VWA domain-containing protein [Planctomycetota bacterium]REJ96357.1 MAG: VWA domain-containing protein [Planctomycetota bacterium]
MLAWLPAVAAPIIIHLWNRRRYREYDWAAMEFLLAALKKSSRRMRIEQLLLLLLRTALILLIVLALAEPFFGAIGAALVGGPRTHRVLVIDGSFSMAFRPAEKTLFEIAKQKAIDIVRASNEGDGFSLILMSETARPIISAAAFDREDVVEEITNLTLPHGGARLLPTVRSIEQVVGRVRNENKKLARSRIYFLTDLGRTTWADSSGAGQSSAELADALQRLAGQGEVDVVPLAASVGSPSATGPVNLAITDVRIPTAFATLRQPVDIEVGVAQWGGTSGTDAVVELLVDGARVDQQVARVEPGESAVTVPFTYQLTVPGEHQIEVRTSGDRLEVDNRRFLALPVKDQVRVLCVSGKKDSTTFIVLSLDPDHGRTSDSIVRADVVAESGLLDGDLSQYDCIFLCNVAQFTAREAAVLKRHLERGGGLVFFLGDQVRADRYNRQLGTAEEATGRILPGTIKQTVEADEDNFFGFDPLDYRHPLVKVWENNERAGLLQPNVLKYFRLELAGDAGDSAADERRADEAEVAVALAYENGDPAIVESRVGDGRVLIMTTAGSKSSVTRRAQGLRPWNYLSTNPSFPVLVQKLWRRAVSGRLNERNVAVFEPISGSLSDAGSEQPLSVLRPAFGGRSSQADRTVRITPDVGSAKWSFDETDQSGIYRVDHGDGAGQQLFAANVNTEESDLARIAVEDLPAGLTAQPSASEDSDVEAVVEAPPTPIRQSILWTAFALLFVEITFAWWLGNRQI